MRSSEILRDLGTWPLSELVEERQLRYLGHIQRYPEGRWVKFMTTAERPGQLLTGRRKQWTKETSARLARLGLNMTQTQSKGIWKNKLAELFPRGQKPRREGQKENKYLDKSYTMLDTPGPAAP